MNMERLLDGAPKPASDTTSFVEKIPRDLVTAFKELAPANISFIASAGPISYTLWDQSGEVKERFGHNRGLRPVKLGRYTSHRDTGTQIYDVDPVVRFFTWWRIWFRTEADRDRLAASVDDLIAEISERDGDLKPMRKGWKDVGPEFSVEFFELECHSIAERLGIHAWDDAGLERLLRQVKVRADQIIASGARGRYSAYEVAISQVLAP